MKNIILVLLCISSISCQEETVPEPDNLLSDEQMEEIIYDITILQAAHNISPDILNEKKIVSNEFIFKKYKIDSTIFFQNYKFYASKTKKFKQMHKKVIERIVAEKAALDSLKL